MKRLFQLTYQDRARASREMGELSRWLPPATLNRFDLLLSASAAPEQGLRYFARLHEQQPSWFQRSRTAIFFPKKSCGIRSGPTS